MLGVPDHGGVYRRSRLGRQSCRAIAIRTLVSRGDTIYVQAGAGLVADSVPELEYQECVNKARALFQAVKLAERM